MAKWTVALFGHFKEIPLEVDDPVEYAAAIKRAQPGDVIAFKPWDERNKWTPNERAEFLIVTIDGLTEEQMNGLVEQEWDLTSYEKMKTQVTYEAEIADIIDNMDPGPEKAAKMQWWTGLSQAEKDAAYLIWRTHQFEACRFPKTHSNKRRFIIDPVDLAAKGVDIDRMVDRSDQYDPQPEFVASDIYDRVNARKVNLGIDNLNRIEPRTDAEIDADAI
jgi:hypothetical protein